MYKIIIILTIIIILILTIILLKKEKFNLTYRTVYKNIIPISEDTLNFQETNQSKYDELKSRLDNYQPHKDGVDEDGNDILEKDEVYIKVCCQLALRSYKLGNFGIGCVIVDPLLKLKPKLKDASILIDGKKINYLNFIKSILESLGYKDTDNDPIMKYVVGIGLNQLFYYGFFEGKQKPHVRSDRHGEMVAMDLLEDAVSSVDYQKEFQTQMPEGLALYTQLESCSMCMSRLASSSISAVYHGAPDNGGGMAHKLCSLPPIFIGLSNGQNWKPASITGKIEGDNLVQLCFEAFGISINSVGDKQNNRLYGCPDNCPSYNYCVPTNTKSMINRMRYDLSGFTYY